jgi:hypothetical protein
LGGDCAAAQFFVSPKTPRFARVACFGSSIWFQIQTMSAWFAITGIATNWLGPSSDRARLSETLSKPESSPCESAFPFGMRDTTRALDWLSVLIAIRRDIKIPIYGII